MSTAVVMCDTDLRVTYLNDAAQMLIGINQQRGVGRKLDDLVRAPDSFAQDVHAAMDSGRAFTMRETSIDLPASSQTINVDCTFTPLLAVDVPVAHGGLIELYEVDRIMRLVRETEWRERHEANRAVIRGMAHEVKNPLGGLRGAAQLLERELPDESLREYTQVIIREADRLNRLVEQMVGPSRRFESTSVNVHDVLEHIRTLIRIENDSHPERDSSELQYRIDYDPSLPDIAADREQIVQAFLNIVRNALQAMNYRGKFVVRTRVEYQFTIGRQRHRQVLRADFIDDGPGVPEEIRETLFYPLVTGRADGTGLGLSITQEIIRQVGGQIDVASQPGETIFSVYLPFYQSN